MAWGQIGPSRVCAPPSYIAECMQLLLIVVIILFHAIIFGILFIKAPLVKRGGDQQLAIHLLLLQSSIG